MFYVPHIHGDDVATRNANRFAEIDTAMKDAEDYLKNAAERVASYRKILADSRYDILSAGIERHHASSLAGNIGSEMNAAQRRMFDAQTEIQRAVILGGGFEFEQKEA